MAKLPKKYLNSPVILLLLNDRNKTSTFRGIPNGQERIASTVVVVKNPGSKGQAFEVKFS